MKRSLYLFAIMALLALMQIPANGQYKDQGFTIGVMGGGAIGLTEAEDRPIRAMGRIDFGFPILDRLQGVIGGGSVRIAGSIGKFREGHLDDPKFSMEHSTDLIPIDFRFRLAILAGKGSILYAYGGAGWLHYAVETVPGDSVRDRSLEKGGWTAFIPYGVGLQIRAGEHWALRLDGGSNYTFSDALNPASGDADKKDSYATFGIGLSYAIGSGNRDADKDGLTDKLEKQIGTDPNKADTDGDRFNDGEEYNQYKTDPLKEDTDNDGLNDGDEVLVEKTNPLKADSDDDGLKDGDEMLTYKTDPLKADTDGDGLNDGVEVLTNKTNPTNADSDADGLKDGEEVNSYKTSPLKADTDAGTVSDGVEVARGTNPLDPSDDLPKKEVLKIEKGQAIVLEGIVFKTASSEILPASAEILTKAYNTLEANPDMEVEIQGHTDNVGKHDYNVTLSQSRANAVKQWLVNAGISARRITTKGFSYDKPKASNDTPEGRQQNRRIEFLRVK